MKIVWRGRGQYLSLLPWGLIIEEWVCVWVGVWMYICEYECGCECLKVCMCVWICVCKFSCVCESLCGCVCVWVSEWKRENENDYPVSDRLDRITWSHDSGKQSWQNQVKAYFICLIFWLDKHLHWNSRNASWSLMVDSPVYPGTRSQLLAEESPQGEKLWPDFCPGSLTWPLLRNLEGVLALPRPPFYLI